MQTWDISSSEFEHFKNERKKKDRFFQHWAHILIRFRNKSVESLPPVLPSTLHCLVLYCPHEDAGSMRKEVNLVFILKIHFLTFKSETKRFHLSSYLKTTSRYQE